MRACGERFWPGPPVSTSHRMPWPKPSPRPRGEDAIDDRAAGSGGRRPHRRWAARGPATPRAAGRGWGTGAERRRDGARRRRRASSSRHPARRRRPPDRRPLTRGWLVRRRGRRAPRPHAGAACAATPSVPAGGSARCWRCQMADRLDEAVRSLERVPVPLAWDDVEAPCPDRRRRRPHRARADRALCGVVASWWPLPWRWWPRGCSPVVAVVGDDGGESLAHRHEPLDGGAGRTSVVTPTSTPTPTTLPATRSSRTFPVIAWTGDAYLAWSGEAGDGDGSGRADGWLFDPSTGATVDIPVAPIASSLGGRGVWTGEELVVCCGRGMGSGAPCTRRVTPRPTTRRRPPGVAWPIAWRAPTRGFGAAVWTGEEMIVIFGDPGFGFAYDPAWDRWRSTGRPTSPGSPRRCGPAPRSSSEPIPGGDGRRLPARSGGWHLAPASRHGFRSSRRGEGASLDRRPARRLGLAASDESTTTGGRSRPGDGAWRSISDPGLWSIEWTSVGTPGSQARLGCAERAGSWSGRRTAMRVGGIRRHPAPPLRPQRRRLVRPWFLHPGLPPPPLTIGAGRSATRSRQPRRHLDPLTSIC